jgi:hypothetical protein
MRILYLDEAGGPNSWHEQKNFVLGGVAVHDGQIYTLTKELNILQEKYFPDISVPIEFHARPIRQGKGPYFNEFNYDTRCEIIDEVYDIIVKSGFPNLIPFATVIDSTAVINSNQVCHDCFTDVCKNFNAYLYDQFKKGFPSKGLLIIDRGRERQYRQHFGELKKSEAAEEYLPNIVDIPYFAACRETRMLQVADFISNAVFRYYEWDTTENFEKISPLFFQGSYHQPIKRLNHITKAQNCQCRACK